MSISLNGNIGSIYLGNSKIDEIYKGSTKIYTSSQPIPVIDLPVDTFRFKFGNTSFTPTSGSSYTENVSRYGTWSVVDASQGIWDCTADSNGLGGFAFSSDKNCGDVELLAGNFGNQVVNLLWHTNYLNTKIKKIYDLYSSANSGNGYVSGITSCTNLEYFRSYKNIDSNYAFRAMLQGLIHLKNIPDFGSNYGFSTSARQFLQTAYYIGYARQAFNGCISIQNADDWFRNSFVYSDLAKYMVYEPLTEYNTKYYKYVNHDIDYSTFNGVPNTIIPDYLGGNLQRTLVESRSITVSGSTAITESFTAHPGDIFKITCTRNPDATGSDYVMCYLPSISAYGTEPNNSYFTANTSTPYEGWYLTGYSGSSYNTTRTVTLTLSGYGSYTLRGTVDIEQYTYPF